MEDVQAQKKNKVAQILGLVGMLLAFFAIFLAIGFDIFSFKEVILQFIAALILPVLAFVVFFIAMLASLILIFGIILLKEYGFWPLTLSFQFFKEIINDIKVTPSQISTFLTCRIILIIICLSIIGLAIASIVLNTEQEVEVRGVIVKRKNKGASATSTFALIFGILGLLVSVAALTLVSQL